VTVLSRFRQRAVPPLLVLIPLLAIVLLLGNFCSAVGAFQAALFQSPEAARHRERNSCRTGRNLTTLRRAWAGFPRGGIGVLLPSRSSGLRLR